MRTKGPKDVMDVDYDGVEKPADLETQTSLPSLTGASSLVGASNA